jgi:hypothetical protein
MKTEKMTLEQHKALGVQIKQFGTALMQTHVLRVGPKTSRESRAVFRALEHLGRLRNELDNVVRRDFEALKGTEALSKIYYNMSAACYEQWVRA